MFECGHSMTVMYVYGGKKWGVRQLRWLQVQVKDFILRTSFTFSSFKFISK